MTQDSFNLSYETTEFGWLYGGSEVVFLKFRLAQEELRLNEEESRLLCTEMVSAGRKVLGDLIKNKEGGEQ